MNNRFRKPKKSKDKKFLEDLNSEINRMLPKKKPYKIGIDKDIFEHLKAMYPGQRTKLRRGISIIMNYKTNEYSYIEILMHAHDRYGFDSKKYPISLSDKKRCKRRLHEIRTSRDRHLKAVKKIIKKNKNKPVNKKEKINFKIEPPKTLPSGKLFIVNSVDEPV